MFLITQYFDFVYNIKNFCTISSFLGVLKQLEEHPVVFSCVHPSVCMKWTACGEVAIVDVR